MNKPANRKKNRTFHGKGKNIRMQHKEIAKNGGRNSYCN